MYLDTRSNSHQSTCSPTSRCLSHPAPKTIVTVTATSKHRLLVAPYSLLISFGRTVGAVVEATLAALPASPLPHQKISGPH